MTTDKSNIELFKSANLMPLWLSATAHKPSADPEPPRHWSWSTLHKMIEIAIAEASTDDVERRALTLTNERAGGGVSALRSLSCAVQILLPGEKARPHRHSINALRFVLQGAGATTLVDGKPCFMSAGDLVLTPGWAWHEHVHDGDVPVIWLDVLDGPLHRFLGTAVFESGPANNMPATLNDSAFTSGLVIPDIRQGADTASPVFRYSYDLAAGAVAAAPAGPDGLRTVRYVNPLTGHTAIPLMDTRLTQIESDWNATRRTNSNSLCCVVEGTGESRIGRHTIKWGPRDVFTVPQDHWVSHRSLAGPARVFSVSDREVFERLGLLREEYRANNASQAVEEQR